MFASLDRIVRSWTAGLADAVLAAIDVLHPPVRLVARCDDAGGWTLISRPRPTWPKEPATAGATRAATQDAEHVVGHIETTQTGLGTLPEAIRRTIDGADVEIAVPIEWELRRKLDPVPAKSAAFLDGYVRHHLERVTPWRAGDTYYGFVTSPVVGAPDKLSVEIAVIARALVDPIVDLIIKSAPRRIILTQAANAASPVFIEVPAASAGARRRIRAQRWISVAIAAYLVVTIALIGFASWYQSMLDDRLETIDRNLASQRALMVTAESRGPSGAIMTTPDLLRTKSPPVVTLIDILSNVLPDHAYLNDLHVEAGRIRLAGVSHDAAGLVPVIERSGSFTEVGFFAPTTRLPDQSADRFFIEMRIRPPAKVAILDGKGP